MKIKPYIIFLLLGATSFAFTGCDNFLDKNPSRTSSVPVTHCDQLEALMERFADFAMINNYTYIFSTDNSRLDLDMYESTKHLNFWYADELAYKVWDTENIPFDPWFNETWSDEYRKIFTANTVLDYVGKVDGTPEQKQMLKAEAHLVRAYSMMELVNTYCLYYNDATKNEPGLVLKRSTSFEESDVRATLEQTHGMIRSDLSAALELSNPIVVDGRVRSWRGSKAAAHAVSARYWLERGDYTQALAHAEEALSLHSRLKDYNTEMRYSTVRSTDYTHYPNDPEVAEQLRVNYPYTSDLNPGSNPSDALAWEEFYFYRILDNGTWLNCPTQQLVETYDKDYDLRYRYHMVEGFTLGSPMGATRYPSFVYYGYSHFHYGCTIHGPTVAEMILIKAECEARQGNTDDAMKTVNLLRAARFDSSAPSSVVNLASGSRQDAVEKILAERRREMPFGQRWPDLRRFNNNDDDFDDVEITRTFFPYNASSIFFNDTPVTYTLNKNSRRWACPIPNDDVISSDGRLQQNTY